MRALKITGLAAALTVAGAFLVGASPAHATTRPQTPAQRTCSAFHAYERHTDTGHLATLITDATRLRKSWLKSDVGRLFADVSSPSPKAGKYLGDDMTQVNIDCGG